MSETQVSPGLKREGSLALSEYFQDSYFALPQLFSLAHQVHGIHRMRPKSILEIGIGNGFVSDFFKKSGVNVRTADINPALEPDILAALHELPQHIEDQRVDVVVCCEVLEHMPLTELPQNIEVLRSLGDRLYLTLPNYRKAFGLAGMLRVPKMATKPWSFTIDWPGKKPLAAEHFWEVGHSPLSSHNSIIRQLKKHYSRVDSGRFELNRYHRFYVASA